MQIKSMLNTSRHATVILFAFLLSSCFASAAEDSVPKKLLSGIDHPTELQNARGLTIRLYGLHKDESGPDLVITGNAIAIFDGKPVLVDKIQIKVRIQGGPDYEISETASNNSTVSISKRIERMFLRTATLYSAHVTDSRFGELYIDTLF